MARTKLPRFKNEREEADWYAAHPEYFTEKFKQAQAEGRLKRLSELDWERVKREVQEARQSAGPSPTITIRLQQEDIERAKRLAERKGLRYQTYIKMLLHEALEREETQARP